MLLKFIGRNGGQTSVLPAIVYNSRKTDRHVATIIDLKGIGSEDEIEEVFERLCRGAVRRCDDKVLHFSLNPEPGVPEDDLSDDRIRELVSDIMGGLGFGRQPWVVYRHDDIDRKHYHIISCRIDASGRKISAWKEHMRAQEIMRELMPRYGYTRSFDEGKKRRDVSVLRYDPALPLLSQARVLSGLASEYAFTTREQFVATMASMGIGVSITDDTAVYYGLKGGRRCTAGMSAMAAGLPSPSEIDRMAVRGRAELGRRSQHIRTRIAAISRRALGYALSERHFAGIMRKMGIDVSVSRSVNGRVFGLTYIDHATRSCFKASELADAARAADIQSKYDGGEWKEQEARADGNGMSGYGEYLKLKVKGHDLRDWDRLLAEMTSSGQAGSDVSVDRDLNESEMEDEGLSID